MKTIKIEESKFQFEEFTRKILEFLKPIVSEEVHPSSAISIVDEHGDAEFGPDEGRSNFLEELRTGKQLFFPFSDHMIAEQIACADGVERQLPVELIEVGEESGEQGGQSEELHEKSEEPDEESGFSGNVAGYLVKLDEGNFIIDSAYWWEGSCQPPSPPSVKVSDCYEFDEPMEAFIRSFVSTG